MRLKMTTLSRPIGLLSIAGALWYFKDPARRSKFLNSDRKPCEIENDPQFPHERNRRTVVSGSVFAHSQTLPNWYNKSQERSWLQQLSVNAISPPTPSSEKDPPEEEHWQDQGYVPPIPNAPPFEDMPQDQFIDDGIDRMFDDDSDIEVNGNVGEVDPQGAAGAAVEAPNVNLPTGGASSSSINRATQPATSSTPCTHESAGESTSGQLEPKPGPSSSSQTCDSAENPQPQGDGSIRPRCQPSPSGLDDKHD